MLKSFCTETKLSFLSYLYKKTNKKSFAWLYWATLYYNHYTVCFRTIIAFKVSTGPMLIGTPLISQKQCSQICTYDILTMSVSMYNVIFFKRNQVKTDQWCHHAFKITWKISSPDKTRCWCWNTWCYRLLNVFVRYLKLYCIKVTIA